MHWGRKKWRFDSPKGVHRALFWPFALLVHLILTWVEILSGYNPMYCLTFPDHGLGKLLETREARASKGSQTTQGSQRPADQVLGPQILDEALLTTSLAILCWPQRLKRHVAFWKGSNQRYLDFQVHRLIEVFRVWLVFQRGRRTGKEQQGRDANLSPTLLLGTWRYACRLF